MVPNLGKVRTRFIGRVRGSSGIRGGYGTVRLDSVQIFIWTGFMKRKNRTGLDQLQNKIGIIPVSSILH